MPFIKYIVDSIYSALLLHGSIALISWDLMKGNNELEIKRLFKKTQKNELSYGLRVFS